MKKIKKYKTQLANFFSWRYLFLIITLALTSCNTQVAQSIRSNKNQHQNLKVKYINGSEFEIYSAQSQMSENPVLTFYLEGDGFAWKSRTKLSDDPTPKNAVALKLAIKENKPDTIYLARPCQYGGKHLGKKCSQIYWSSHRYSPEIIESVSRAITILKNNNNKTTIRLIGFSGGGAIAVLVAARRNDVDAIYTVAGNLNSKLIMERHQVSALKGSLEPLDVAEQISHIPQIHFYGEKDKIVFPEVAYSFFNASGSSSCMKITSVKGMRHLGGWARKWRALVQKEPGCF